MKKVVAILRNTASVTAPVITGVKMLNKFILLFSIFVVTSMHPTFAQRVAVSSISEQGNLQGPLSKITSEKGRFYLSYGEKTLGDKEYRGIYTRNGMDLVLSDDTNLTVGYAAVAQGYTDEFWGDINYNTETLSFEGIKVVDENTLFSIAVQRISYGVLVFSVDTTALQFRGKTKVDDFYVGSSLAFTTFGGRRNGGVLQIGGGVLDAKKSIEGGLRAYQRVGGETETNYFSPYLSGEVKVNEFILGLDFTSQEDEFASEQSLSGHLKKEVGDQTWGGTVMSHNYKPEDTDETSSIWLGVNLVDRF